MKNSSTKDLLSYKLRYSKATLLNEMKIHSFKNFKNFLQ